MSYFIQKDPNYNVNTNRLLNETENLNSKVEQYRKTLLLGFPSSRNDSINMTMFKTGGIYNPNPNIQINSLNSLSKEFVSMSKKPEDLIQEISNNFPVKNSYNNINDIYINNLKQSYEKHINDLYSNFKLCLCKLEEISENYNNQGGKIDTNTIKNIINDNLFYERENQIEGFIEEISELKAQKENEKNELIKSQLNNVEENYKRELQKNKEENDKIVSNLREENSKQQENIIQCNEELNYLKSDNEETKNEMDRLQKIISVLEIDLNTSENKLKEKTQEYEDLKIKFSDLQTQYFDASLKYKKYLEENKSLQGIVDHYEKERKEMLEKYSSINFDESTNLKVSSFEKNLKEQIENSQKKINEYKIINLNLEKELKETKEKLQLNQKNFNSTINDMQDKVKLLSSEWEKKLKKEQNDYETVIIGLEEKNKNQLDLIYKEHQNEIELKNKEIEKLKGRDELLKNFEKEYIKISEHENKINEIINQYKNKYQKEFEEKKNLFEEDYKSKLSKIDNEKKVEYDFLTENIKSNLIKVEKENVDLKNKINKNENKINNLSLKNEELLNQVSKLTLESKSKDIELQKYQNELKYKEIDVNTSLEEKSKLLSEIKSLKEKNNISDFENNFQKEKDNNMNLKSQINVLVLTNKELEKKIQYQNELLDSQRNMITYFNMNKQKLISTISYLKNELSSIKQDYNKNKIQLQNKNKETFEKIIELIRNYEKNKNNGLKEIEKKFEKHLTEQLRINGKLERENKVLQENKNKTNLNINDLKFKISELENELKNYKNISERKNTNIENKQNEIDNLKGANRELTKKLNNSVSETLLKMNKLKKKYQSEIFTLKTELNNLKQIYLSDIQYIKSQNQDELYKSKLNISLNDNNELKENIQKLQNKMKALIMENESKIEQIDTMKMEYNKIIMIKDKKIKNLQNIVNQSLNSYNNGINSIKIAKKLNNDVKQLMEKAKNNDTTLLTSNNFSEE
jgi:hypothetical protein